MKLIRTGRVALAFTLPDTAWDAYNGNLKGLNEKVGVRSLMALYSNFMHIVALDGTGIKSVADLKGKRVSTGAPGSGTEVKALRVMEAYGVTPKDLKSQERLGAGESAGALKDRRIDAFFWTADCPRRLFLISPQFQALKSISTLTVSQCRKWWTSTDPYISSPIFPRAHTRVSTRMSQWLR